MSKTADLDLDLVQDALRPLSGDAEDAEVFLLRTRRLALESDPALGQAVTETGTQLRAAVRVWRDGRLGTATGPFRDRDELSALVESARVRAAEGPRLLPPPEPVRVEATNEPDPELSIARATRRADEAMRALEHPRLTPQTLLYREEVSSRTLLRLGGALQRVDAAQVQLLVRCETERGGVVDGVASPRLDGRLPIPEMADRVVATAEAVGGALQRELPPLPLLLRPPVSATLAYGLAALLRGDVAAQNPGLARAVGKKIFPDAVTLVDAPAPAGGAFLRAFDDEGQRCADAVLIQQGRLCGFLHDTASAGRLGVPSNGRGFRSPEAMLPSPGHTHPHLAPGGSLALPSEYLELVGRLETFNLMPRAGILTLVVAGYEVRGGQRVAAIPPFEWHVPVLKALRYLIGAGDDLRFFPSLERCGAPSVLLGPQARDPAAVGKE